MMQFKGWLVSQSLSERISVSFSRRRRRRPRPAVVAAEVLEDRTLLSQVFAVTNADDSGAGSLRQAVADANTTAGADIIEFADSLAGGTIVLSGGSLSIGEDLTIDGLGADRLTVSGNDSDRVFEIGAGIEVGISGLTITGGRASRSGLGTGVGGAIENAGDLTVAESVITGNVAEASAGGIFNMGNAATLEIVRTTISENSADGNGGGIFNQGTLTIIESTISGNTAGLNGGGLNDVGRQLTILGSTISGNTAGTNGGGIHNFGTLTAVNATIFGNRAAADPDRSGTGGGISNRNSATLHNTIVLGNLRGTGDNEAPDDLAGTVDGTHNLIGDASTAGGLMDGEDGNIVGEDATAVLDAVLSENGGPTLTHALLDGSPAIDAGNDGIVDDAGLTTDQRGEGFARIVGAAVDIGAFEFQGRMNLPPEAVDDTGETAEDVSVTIDVLANDSDPDGDPLAVTEIGDPSHGTVVINSDGTLTYTPEVDFQGMDSFSYVISDGRGGTATATVTVTVLSPDRQVDEIIVLIDDLVDRGVLNKGQGNSLITKLKLNGTLQATLNRLAALVSHIRALVRAGVLPAEDGERLSSAVEDLRTSLSTRAG